VRLRAWFILPAILVLGVATGCTSGGSRSASGSGPPTTMAPEHHMTGPMTKATTPEQLRGQFEELLGQHTFLVGRLTRSMVANMPDLRQAAEASIHDNSNALRQVVASAYGGAQADRFGPIWQRHIDGLTAYADATARHDEQAKQKARSELSGFADAYGSWLAAASKGRVQAGAATAGMRAHVDGLTRQLDAYAAGDYAQAFQVQRTTYEAMFASGASLARASLAPKLVPAFDAAPNKLRSAFAMLLGEHMELIVEAQRATFAGSPEFKAAASQVNANTTAMAQAMGSIVGPQKGAEFQSDWADHVEGLMAYTAAVAGNDQAGKAEAEKRLNSFAVTLADYFSRVVQNQLDLVPLTGAITTHDRHLIDQVQAYAAKDYGGALAMERDGYQQMLGVANTLVDAIQRTMQPKLPQGGANTGGGGTAQRAR
jgi:hypothetical protein